MNLHHNLKDIKIDNNYLSMVIDEKHYKFVLKEVSLGLYNASKEEKEYFEISPSGYGIHWPLIDEDLSIDGLLKKEIKKVLQNRTIKKRIKSKKV